MALVVIDDTLRAYQELIVLAEVFALLLGMSHTIVDFCWLLNLCFFIRLVFSFDLLHKCLCFFVVETVKNRKVFDELFYVRTEIGSACWTSEYVTRTQIHQAVLAESVSTRQNTRYFLFVVVLIVTNRTGHLHYN